MAIYTGHWPPPSSSFFFFTDINNFLILHQKNGMQNNFTIQNVSRCLYILCSPANYFYLNISEMAPDTNLRQPLPFLKTYLSYDQFQKD